MPNQPSLVTIEQPARPLAARHRLARKDDLVADQRQQARRARHVQRAAPVAGDEAAVHLGELHQAERFEQVDWNGRYSPNGTRWTLS